MTRPIRLRLSRAPGFNLQALSRAANGLPAVSVARPGQFGNPFRVGSPDVPDSAAAVEKFRTFVGSSNTYRLYAEQVLRGKNLACWCKEGEPCHADVLLEIANK